jgi:hypothetical protein
MINTLARAAFVASLTLIAGVASARPELARPPQIDLQVHSLPPTPLPEVAKAPELSPTTSLSAVTLLVGGLLVLRGRRARG